jgi:hypothetical protein
MSAKTQKAIAKREADKAKKSAPKPEKALGDYERELMKPDHIPGEYVD